MEADDTILVRGENGDHIIDSPEDALTELGSSQIN